ncbi:MAG TPA: chemotaxis protein CheA, partial [Campylobacterales bacterium]|nr:chemotaxis protein CheA [Campylobacterales bacterium]
MKIEFNEDMKEIFDEFMVEAEEILENLDQELVELENDPSNKELLNQIFRGMHTLKGGAGFLGLSTLIELSHMIESIFDKLRNDEMELDSDKMDIILEGIDILKNGIMMLKESHEIPDKEDIEDILRKLEDLLNEKDVSYSNSTQDKNQKDSNQEKNSSNEKEEYEIIFKEE